MSLHRVIVAAGLLGLVGIAMVAYGRSQSLQAPEDESAGGSILGAVNWQDLGAAADPFVSAFDDLQTEVQSMTNEPSGMSPEANVSAFLQVLQRCEGTAAAGGYACLYGSTPARPVTFSNFSDHPKLTGEWAGVRLSDVQCEGAGLSPGCISTAAGAYQITRPTWQRVRAKIGLTDFSPASQDAAAVQLLRDCGAFASLSAGDLAGAVSRARRTWASLPGANYDGQGMRTMDQVAAWYSGSGGAVA